MTIYIQSTICEELGLSYDSSGSQTVIETEDFIDAWDQFCVTREWITTNDPTLDLKSSRMLFSTFIENHKSNKMNLINRGSGYFELK